MREKVTPFYRAAAGTLAGFGLIGAMTIGGPFSCSRAPPPADQGYVGALCRVRWAAGVRLLAAQIQRRQDGAEPVLRGDGEAGHPGGRCRGSRPDLGLELVPASYYAMLAVFAAAALLGCPGVACCGAPAAAPLQPRGFASGV